MQYDFVFRFAIPKKQKKNLKNIKELLSYLNAITKSNQSDSFDFVDFFKNKFNTLKVGIEKKYNSSAVVLLKLILKNAMND